MADPPTSFRWTNGGADLHLIAGDTFELKDILELVFQSGTTLSWSDPDRRPTGITVTFTTGPVTFTRPVQGVAVQRDDEFLTGGFFAGHIGSEQAPAVRNFIVTANSTGSLVFTTSIRVFLHDELLSAKVSPPTLHIRAGEGQRFSVLGVFSDLADGRVAADLTRHPGVTWEIAGGNTTDVTRVGDRFDVAATPTDPGLSATVRVTLPETLYRAGQVPGLASRQRDGTVTPAESWAALEAEAEPVGDTKAQAYQSSRNVLFLPEGFAANEREKFNTAVKLIALYMGGHPSARPWDLLLQTKSVNLFKAWLPSFESGNTALNEVAPNPQLGNNLAIRVPVPISPAVRTPGQPTRIDTLENLVWHVGLPTKVNHQRTDFDLQMTDWERLFGPFDPSRRPTQTIWNRWKNLYPRHLPPEKDTAFGVAWGKRSQVNDTLSQRSLGFNGLNRTTREDIDPFLANLYLKGERGNPANQRIGRVWFRTGPDRQLIVFIVNAPNDAGQRSAAEDAAFTSLSTTEYVLLGSPPPDSDIVDGIPAPVPPDEPLPPRVRARAVHEISHIIGLGDEYAEAGLDLQQPPPPRIGDDGNLHVDAQLRATPTGPLDGSRIRWGLQWKRLRAAGAMAQLPEISDPVASTYTFHLSPGHGEAFKGLKNGDRLRMRLRPLVSRSSFPGVPNESPPFLFTSRNRDQIEAAGDADVDTYITNARGVLRPDQIILMAPLLDANSSELGLMHARIAQHITTTNAPLNRAQGSACQISTDFVQRSPNVPNELLPLSNSKRLKLKYLTRLVGLYDGGARYGCLVYHAQATCMMRVNDQIEFQGTGVLFIPAPEGIIAPFCPVCRYVLVDALNPSLHGQMDEDYKSQYPSIP